jgi:phage portal protein BeeE
VFTARCAGTRHATKLRCVLQEHGAAERLKKEWTDKFTGHNVGKVAVLGDGLAFTPVTITAVAAQAVEQLKLAGEQVCTAFGVPAFMVGVQPPPTYTNIEALTQQYWSQCLQAHIEGIECGLTEGLELYDAKTPLDTVVKLDLDVLLRMDTNTRFNAYKTAISGGFMAPNEARVRENMPPVRGGNTPYLQQQNYSLAALAARDELGPPISTSPPAPSPPALPSPDEDPEGGENIPDDAGELTDAELTAMKSIVRILAIAKDATLQQEAA